MGAVEGKMADERKLEQQFDESQGILNQIQQKKDTLTQKRAAEMSINDGLKQQQKDLQKQKNELDVKISREKLELAESEGQLRAQEASYAKLIDSGKKLSAILQGAAGVAEN